MPRLAWLTLLLVAFSGDAGIRLRAHDTFFRVANPSVDPGDSVEVIVFHGTFHESVMQLDDNYPESLTLHGPLGSGPVDMETWEQAGLGGRMWMKWQAMRRQFGWIDKRLTSSFRTTLPAEGSYVVAMALKQAGAAMTPDTFRTYLRSEGLGDEPIALQEYPDPNAIITESYRKFVKIILQAGSTKTANVTQPAGLVVEFVPLVHPAEVSPGGTLAFQLLRNGQPHPHQPVKASHAQPAAGDEASTYAWLRSDDSGRIELPIDKRGVWWISFVAIQAAPPGSETQYDSQWATLTFDIP